MSDTMLEISMEISKTIAAPREKLFNAWLDPEMLVKFMTPGPNMTVPRASADPKVGGRFDVVMRAGDQDLPHSGTYRVIDPHNRIAFAWENPFYTLEDSVVTIDFEDADGGTNVRLTHVRFPSEESRDNHKAGWGSILDALAAAV